MEILDQMALGRDSYLLVVKVQERIFLIGVSPGRISKVEELESYDKKGETEGAPDFVSLLSSHMKEHFQEMGQRNRQDKKAGEKNHDVSLTLQGSSGTGKPMDMLDIMFLFLFLAVVPSLIIMMTSFTRIVIVLSFLRNALGTQQSPPNQILVGLALFLTLFIMSPGFVSVHIQSTAAGYIPGTGRVYEAGAYHHSALLYSQ